MAHCTRRVREGVVHCSTCVGSSRTASARGNGTKRRGGSALYQSPPLVHPVVGTRRAASVRRRAPSVATAGRPRLERHCASQPRAPSERDEHTRRPCAPPTILALEPSVLIPIYSARCQSLMFLFDRKRVFTPRASDPTNNVT